MPKQSGIGNQREQEILREIRLAGGSCRISVLARQLKVSDETVRRNIKSLQSSGLVKKVHGGVSLTGSLSTFEQPFQRRMDKNAEAKIQLAGFLAKTIENGDSLFLDTGSTVAYVAKALQNHQDLYVVTHSINVAQLLTGRNNNRVFFAGGELRNKDGAAFGQNALEFVRGFNLHYAIVSVSAINAQGGFMLYETEEADMTSAALGQAQFGITVADATKFGTRAPVTLQSPDKIDKLVTDEPPDEAIAAMLTQNEIAVDVVS